MPLLDYIYLYFKFCSLRNQLLPDSYSLCFLISTHGLQVLSQSLIWFIWGQELSLQDVLRSFKCLFQLLFVNLVFFNISLGLYFKLSLQLLYLDLIFIVFGLWDHLVLCSLFLLELYECIPLFLERLMLHPNVFYFLVLFHSLLILSVLHGLHLCQDPLRLQPSTFVGFLAFLGGLLQLHFGCLQFINHQPQLLLNFANFIISLLYYLSKIHYLHI